MKIVIQGACCETMASNLIVNVVVHCRRTSTTSLPWHIAKADHPKATIRSFFNDSIATKMALGRYDGRNKALSKVFIGKTKELMGLVDPDLVAVHKQVLLVHQDLEMHFIFYCTTLSSETSTQLKVYIVKNNE